MISSFPVITRRSIFKRLEGSGWFTFDIKHDTYFQKPYCILCDINSHKLNSCKKYSSFEERKKRCEKLNLCSKYTSRKHKNEGCTGRKNRLRLACLKCNSKCHISALCDKPKTTSLYTSLEISQRND